MNKKVIKVGIAELGLAAAPDIIRTSGLGSCVGLIIYDELKETAVLAHIMLPDSSLSRADVMNPYKYADTAIAEAVYQLAKAGCDTKQLKAKMAGGAQMFRFQPSSDLMRIGPRNVEAILEQLKKHDIHLVSSDIGGSSGRTVEFDPSTSLLFIKTVNQELKYL
ncbi:chemotaxis protein CheD [Bacillus lacus]|uniref:Probable chemoreceptor glutamine deamidase CheD n=1 Tax=Metabacillus lacus TaxID=1983721 RepID=A0A7X2IW88_9BACI|nr:chemotaxis protein CheD [Metabacillus lacus]MRX70617.1 chemotaxis protein CheD [Metabacillus lacus]